MDFKVAGTADGVTAIQMDNKVGGITKEVMRKALMQARDARLFILGVMEKALASPRKEVSAYAPRIVTIKIKQDKIRDVIGPGGKVIRGLVEETGCKIDVEDDGTVLIASADGAALDRAIAAIQAITAEPEIGKIYNAWCARSSISARSSKSCRAPTACSTSRRYPTSAFARSRMCCMRAMKSPSKCSTWIAAERSVSRCARLNRISKRTGSSWGGAKKAFCLTACVF